MTRRFTRVVLSLLLAYSLAQVAACGRGGEDKPFSFGDGSGSSSPTPPTPSVSCTSDSNCTSPQVCDASLHTCHNPTPPTSCNDNSGCTAPQVCDVSTHTCRNPTTPSCTDDTGCSGGLHCKNPSGSCVQCLNDAQCPSGQACNLTTNSCSLSGGTCDVDFNASLVLKIDDDDSAVHGHFDSPPKCCEYANAGGSSSCPSLASGDLDHFLQSPSDNTDLYCCASDPSTDTTLTGIPSQPGVNSLYCDHENRHGGVPELAVTRWAANAGGKIRLKFAISGSSCQVSMVRDLFPQFRLENSALDASIVIDAGKDYVTLTPGSTQQLNQDEIVTPCTATADGSGNVQVSIPELPLRFMVQLYDNYTKCTQVDHGGASCGSGSFTSPYFGGSYQIIPGFSNPALTLTTNSAHVDPTSPTHQSGPMNLQGTPLHFEGGETKLSLVTAFSMPPSSAGTNRNDNTGAGQLLAELASAMLSAEISGTVTRTNGQPIQTLADLTTGCGGGVVTGPQKLDLEMHSVYGSTNENLTITGDPTHPTQPFTAEACVPGSHTGTACTFFDAPNLPFAKDAGDPLAGTESKFIKEGTLQIQNKGTSNVSVTLQVPSKVGAFEITNSAALQNITLAPGNSTTLNVRFEPEVSASGCTTAAGVVNCQASLGISSSHSIAITLKGRAKVPAAEIKLEEIGTAAPNTAIGTLLPAATPPTVDFGETLLGIQTKTNLYKLSNSGVRNLVLNSVQAADVRQNFRLGSVYQGADFASRTWKIGMNPWTVAPSGSSDFFFFLNYGPFGKVGGGPGNTTRSDVGTLVLNTASGVQSVNLAGTAKKDSRATLALYVEDPSRYMAADPATRDSDPDLKNVTESGTPKHLYLARNVLWSFRQDNAPRAVYLFNNGTAAGVDNLVVQRLHFNADAGGKIAFTPDVSPQVTACLAAVAGATSTCATLTAAGDTNKLKLGTMTFTPGVGSYVVSEGGLLTKTVSQPSGGGSGVPPIIGGSGTTVSTENVVTFALKGATGAPNGTHDLKVHRLIAGFSNKINQGLQKTLIVSDATKGIVDRFGNGSFPSVTWKEVFTLHNGISLDPVTGQATLTKIVTALDPAGSPASPASVNGLRIFNAPGSTPSNNEYYVQCGAASMHNCAFFYLYIGDWAGSTTSVPSDPSIPVDCRGKVPVVVAYSGTQANRDTQFATVLRPDNPPANPNGLSCLQGAQGIKNKTNGLFDPVTGEITFNDLAVRLYAPLVPALSSNNIDATLHMSLTTKCVAPDEVPDPDAQSQYLVPSATLTDTSFDAALMGPVGNPLLPYVDQPGTVCGTARELHGRPMFVPDTTNTLDDTDFGALNFNGFDIAGVGRNVTSSLSVNPANMYIVIKAEIM